MYGLELGGKNGNTQTLIITPFFLYQTYLALKMHFNNENYDFFKYNGKVKANKISFEKRKDRYFFGKLARKENDVGNILLSNFVKNSNVWIGDIVSDDGMKTYREWKGYKSAILYNFDNDLKKIGDLKQSIQPKEDGLPEIVNLLISEKISYETVIILDKLLSIMVYLDRIEESFLWPEIRLKLKKYSSFFSPNQNDYRKFIGSLKKHVGS